MEFYAVFRLALGVIVMVQGIMANEWLMAGLGALFALMPLMNVGCCGVNGCNTPIAKSGTKSEEITYEEVR